MLKIQDVGFVLMGGVMFGVVFVVVVQEVVEDDIFRVKEWIYFIVCLIEVNFVDKVKLIKEIKNYIQGINFVQVKKLVEFLFQEIKVNVVKVEVEKIKVVLEVVGGMVVLEQFQFRGFVFRCFWDFGEVLFFCGYWFYFQFQVFIGVVWENCLYYVVGWIGCIDLLWWVGGVVVVW